MNVKVHSIHQASRRAKRYLSTAMLAIVCASCAQMAAEKNDYYVINTQALKMCNQKGLGCMSFSLAGTVPEAFYSVQEAYQQTFHETRASASLMSMVLKPADKAYTAQPLGEGSGLWQVPSTERTRLVYRQMDEALTILHRDAD